MAIGRFNLSLTGVQSGGLVYVGGTTFSAASTVSVDNMFSSTYDNYLLKLDVVGSTDAGINFRLRASGSDNTTLNYTSLQLFATGGSPGATETDSSDSWSRFFNIVPNLVSSTINLSNPYTSNWTSFTSLMSGYKNTSPGDDYIKMFGGHFEATNSFDGFTLITTSGNMTGTVRIYGYRNDNN